MLLAFLLLDVRLPVKWFSYASQKHRDTDISTSDLCRVQRMMPHNRPHFHSSSLFPLHLLRFPPVHSSSTLSLGPTSSTSSPPLLLSFPVLCLNCCSLHVEYEKVNTSPLKWDNFSPYLAAPPLLLLPPTYPTDLFQMLPVNFPPHFKL